MAGPAFGLGFLSPYLFFMEKDVILLCGHLVDMVMFLTTFTLPSIKPILVLGGCLDDKAFAHKYVSEFFMLLTAKDGLL